MPFRVSMFGHHNVRADTNTRVSNNERVKRKGRNHHSAARQPMLCFVMSWSRFVYAHFKIIACRTLHILCSIFVYKKVASEKAIPKLARTEFNHCANGLQDLWANFYGLNSDKDTDNEVRPERDKTVAYEFSNFLPRPIHTKMPLLE